MCEWCDRLIFMPNRWNKHAFKWANKVLFFRSRSAWNSGYWERHYWRRASVWVDDMAHKGSDLGSRHYGNGWGSRYYESGRFT